MFLSNLKMLTKLAVDWDRPWNFGIGIMVFGDVMQLQPVQGRYIFQPPSNPEFRTADAIEPRWRLFKSVLLEINHRQGDQGTFADMLNRIRIGSQTEQDLKALRTRVRKEKHEDIKTASIFIGCKKKKVAEVNLRYLIKFTGDLIQSVAKHHHTTMKNFKPIINKADDTVHKTGMVNTLRLRIGVKVMIIRNIDTADMLVNGQIGTLIDVIRSKDAKPQTMIIKLDEAKAGEANRQQNPTLSKKYPGAVFITRMQVSYSIGRRSGDNGSSASVIQFPIRLSYAITAHKVQGKTIPAPAKVAMDLKEVWEPAQAYVMMSRVQALDQVFIVDDFENKIIRADPKALEEHKRLEDTSINRNPGPWDNTKSKALKIASLNCMGLIAHKEDIKDDQKLLKGSVLHLHETSLPKDFNTIGIQLQEFTSEHILIGRGKGISSYIKEKLDYTSSYLGEDELQIHKIRFAEIDSISIYRSSTKSLIQASAAINKMIDDSRPTLITGDLNICLANEPKNMITRILEKKGFLKLIDEATHIQGGHIDHAYWRDPSGLVGRPEVETYSPYYSDHDAILITFKEVN